MPKETNKTAERIDLAAQREQLSSPQVIQQTNAVRHAGDRRAFVKTAPGATNQVQCYLDVDLTGSVITVVCDLVGTSYLNEAVPRLAAGVPLWVKYHQGTWRAKQLFSASEDC